MPAALPDATHLAAATIAALPEMTPARLRALLDGHGDPVATLDAVARGRVRVGAGARVDADLARRWADVVDPAAVAALLRRRGTRVLLETDPDYPIDTVPGRPAVLFVEGAHPDVLRRRRVAVVGTRSATPHGQADAAELGRALADEGVTVVSGMALGIDGAAHRGAVEREGPVAGVVATGIDVEYPRRHRPLYRAVRRHGVLVSEVAFGTTPLPARFPIRNRIIAALAEIVVVVEATIDGGARITAERALDYGRPVLAVPGARRNPAAAGCNALLADGAHPLLDPGDVLVALGLVHGRHLARTRRLDPTEGRPPDASAAYAALAGEPAGTDELLERTGWSPARLVAALADLETAGLVERSGGRWWPH